MVPWVFAHSTLSECLCVCLWDSLSRTHCIARLASKSSWVLALQHSWFFLTLFCNFASQLQNHLVFITSKTCYSSSLSLREHLLKAAYGKIMWHRKVLCTLASPRLPQWNIPKSREEQTYSLWGLVISKCLPYTRSSSTCLEHDGEYEHSLSTNYTPTLILLYPAISLTLAGMSNLWAACSWSEDSHNCSPTQNY